MSLKVKGPKDFTSRLIARLARDVPENDKKGTFVITRSTDENAASVIKYVVKTGIRAFDDRVGGMPIGKTIELIGPPFCGKSAMAVRTAARAQQGFIYERVPSDATGRHFKLQQLKPGTFDVTILYYDNEGSLADTWMKIVDGQMMDAAVEQCDTVDLLWQTMETTVNMVDEEQTKTGRLQFLVVVIDTVAAVSSVEELNADWGKRDYPRGPAQLKEGFRVMIRRLERDNVLLLGTNHVARRMDIRGKAPAYRAWGSNSPGGEAFKYYSVHRVYFEMIRSKYRFARKGGADGMLVYFFTEKNRLRPPFREGRLAMLFGERDLETGEIIREGGFSDLFSLLETLIYNKAANVSLETGAITFKFRQFGIEPKTFEKDEKTAPTLEEQADMPVRGRRIPRRSPAESEEDEDGEVRKKDPRIRSRLEWPQFYKAHAADIEALYVAVNNIVFNKGISFEALDGIGDDIDEDETEE